jgi:predicted nucleic acid-binding protein
MPGVIVIDASIALGWILRESIPDWARQLEDASERTGLDIRVPTLFWLEVGNTLVRRPGLTHEQVLEGMTRLESLGFMDIDLDRATRLRAVDLALRHRLTTYDALYLAVAVDLGASLATLDLELGAAASAYGIRFGDERSGAVREQAPAYASDLPKDPISMAAIGAYVARFRTDDQGTSEAARQVP